MPFGSDCDVAGDSCAAFREDEVRHLGLTGVIGAVKIAWRDLHALDAACGNSGEIHVERLGLGARPLPVDNDVASDTGETSDVGVVVAGVDDPKIQREARNSLHHVERRARRILREEGRVVVGHAARLRCRSSGWRCLRGGAAAERKLGHSGCR